MLEVHRILLEHATWRTGGALVNAALEEQRLIKSGASAGGNSSGASTQQQGGLARRASFRQVCFVCFVCFVCVCVFATRWVFVFGLDWIVNVGWLVGWFVGLVVSSGVQATCPCSHLTGARVVCMRLLS